MHCLFDILSIGESLSLVPPTLIAPGVGFVSCCIYSTVAVYFPPSTVDTHTPYIFLPISSPHFLIA